MILLGSFSDDVPMYTMRFEIYLSLTWLAQR